MTKITPTHGPRVHSIVYTTARATARARKYPGLTGAKKLAARLGCGEVTVYLWEKPGSEHLPKNSRLRRDYLRAIGVTEPAPAPVTP